MHRQYFVLFHSADMMVPLSWAPRSYCVYLSYNRSILYGKWKIYGSKDMLIPKVCTILKINKKVHLIII